MDVSGGSDVEVAAQGEPAGDSDDDEEARGDENHYPLEGIYKNAADKARLMAMTELDRENELGERRDRLQKLEDLRALKLMVAGTESTARKADAGDSSDDEGNRPSAMARRKGAAGERGKKLDELKRKRQDKSAREEKRARRAKGEADDSDEEEESKAREGDWDFTDDEDGEDTRASGKAGKSKRKDASEEDTSPPVTKVEEIMPAVLQRGRLLEYWARDWFADYVKDAYVRIGVGQRDGQPEYRLCQVVGVAEKKASAPYDVDGQRIDIKLTLSQGKAQQDFKVDMISNSPVTPVSAARCLPIDDD